MSEVSDLKDVVENVVSSYEDRIEDISSIFDATPLILNDFQEARLNTKEEREKINGLLKDTLARNEHLRRKDFDRMMQGVLLTQDEKEKEVRNTLKNYFNEQKDMAQTLKESLRKFRDCLAKDEIQRVKESQAFLRGIITKQDERKKEVTSKLKKFQEEQKILSRELNQLLAKGTQLRIKDFKETLKGFDREREKRLASQRERKEETRKRKEEVDKMLSSFREVRQELRPLLRTSDTDVHNRQEKRG